jgi:probable blue pigment (indigoidine) exporter
MISRPSWRNIPWIPLAFVLVASFWGGSFVAIEVGLHEVPPLLFAAVRYDLAGLVILAYALATTDRWYPRDTEDWTAVAVAAALVIAAYHALLYLGEQYIPGTVAAVVISLAPVLTALFAAGLVPEGGLEPTQYLGIALGFAGVVLVVDPSPATFGSTTGLGVLLVFLSAASFGLGSVLVRPLSPSLPARSLQAWAMLGGAGLLHLASVVRGEPGVTSVVSWSPTALAALAYLALGSGVVAFLLYFELLDRVGAAELNLVGYLEPVVATLASWLVLGHTIAPATVMGFLAILSGFVVVKHVAVKGVLVRVVRLAQTV